MTTSRKVNIILHVLAGGLFLAIAGAMELTQTRSLHGSRIQIAIIAVGAAFILVGLLPLPKWLGSLSQKLCISIVTFAVLLVSLEGACRLARFDFVGEQRAYARLPLFYRWPIVPTGEVYYRRNGPEQWTGQPLKQICSILGVSPNPYGSEPTMTSRYDRIGFRHEQGFTDWDIVVAGDSFTELGTLPYDELFTTIMCRLMNTRVLNLGTSNTGPLNQLSYLRDYGMAPSTKRAAIVFYEGNDLVDLDREYTDLINFQKTGKRPYRTFTRETSLLRTLYHMISKRPKFNVKQRVNDLLVGSQPQTWITGYFKSDGGEIPITLRDRPPSRNEMSADTMKELEYFFDQYAGFGKERGLEIWSVFMPCKERAVYGMVRLADNAPADVKDWRPTDLPQLISDMATSRGIRFMDLTPAFTGAAQMNHKLLFNGIYDCHLNTAGSRLVAEEMSRVLSAP